MRASTMACWAALFAAVAGAFPLHLLAQAGTVEGRITLEPAPARRSANRYPGGAAAAHQIQALPAVVYLVGPIPGQAPTAAASSVMAQQDTAFSPAVVAVPVRGSVSFPNRDPFFHNVFSYSSAQRFDLGRYPQGESKSVAFPDAGIVEVFCEVHEFMRGAIVVAENPFHAVVSPDGTFRITGVPPGEHTLAVWHPDHEAVERRISVSAGAATRVEVGLQR